jgi:hypothetical protein
MTRLALFACLSLLAVPAYATFELADPANEALEKDMADEWLNQGEAPCKHFAKDRQRNNEAYFAALKWIMAYVEATNPEIAAAADPNTMTRWINGYCLEHPGEPLATATKAYLQTEGGIVSGD